MVFRSRRTALRLALAVALSASTTWFLLERWVATPTGLTRSVYPEPGLARVDIADGPNLDFTSQPHQPRRLFTVRWTGVWVVDRAGAYDFSLGADDAGVVKIDGSPVIERNRLVGFARTTVTRELTAGPHALDVEYEQGGGHLFLTVGVAPHGEEPRPFPAHALFPTTVAAAPTPRQLTINRVVDLVRVFAIAAWVGVVAWLAWRGWDRVRRAAREDPRGWRGVGATRAAALRARAPWLAAAAAGVIIVIAAALRFETICVMYGPFERPAWLFELEAHTRERIYLSRPVEFHLGAVENPYAGGDPINYLRFARTMTSFYAAHVREPVFPFATKVWLALTDDQNVAVSLASAFFSTLTVLATFLLGSYAFSRWVGLGAALAFAIERDAIAWAAEGWRDDAMAFVFVASCYALVRCQRTPSMANAIGAGVIAGIACLTRITALSFLLPGIVWVACSGAWGWVEAGARPSRRPQVRAALVVLGVLALVAAPYLINCWIAFGDPFYAINYHTTFYRARAGLPYEQPMSVASYLGSQLGRDPAGVVWTFVRGVTTYPFETKWMGFEYWSHPLRVVLEGLSVVGLVWLAMSRTGRLLLVLTAASLVPYAFTWQIPGGGEWRFTMHAYPIYLIASMVALERICAVTVVAVRRVRRRSLRLIPENQPEA